MGGIDHVENPVDLLDDIGVTRTQKRRKTSFNLKSNPRSALANLLKEKTDSEYAGSGQSFFNEYRVDN